MANKKITALTALTTPHDTDVLPIVDLTEVLPSNQNKKITSANLKTYFTTSPILTGDGSVGAPSYSFTSSPTTGWYLSATDQLSATTAGAARVTITSAGLVGIGTTAPPSNLAVTGGFSGVSWTATGRGFSLSSGTYNDTTGTGTIATRYVASFATPTYTANSAITVTDAANLFVSNSPQAGTNVTITKSWAGSFTGFSLFSSGIAIGAFASMPSANINLGGTTSRSMTHDRNTTGTNGNSFTITSGGCNAGTTDGNGGSLVLRGGLSTGAGTSQIAFQTYVPTASSATDNAASTRMVLTENGFLGIGTTSPTATLHITGGKTGTPSSTNGAQFQSAASTFTDSTTAASGTASGFNQHSFLTPTIVATNASVTTTNAQNVLIQGAPIAGTNETLTTSYALRLSGSAVTSNVVTSVGLAVAANTGATNNYAAYFTGGNVGFGTTAPTATITISGAKNVTPATTTAPTIFNGNATYTDTATAGSGTAAVTNINYFGTNTLAATNSTVTTTQANAIKVAAGVTAGTNQTITNSNGLLLATTALTGVTAGTSLAVQAPTGATTNYAAYFTGGNSGFGITTPTALVHLDGGTATASEMKVTAGSTSGTTSTDGVGFGIDASANGYVKVYEAKDLIFYANNTETIRYNSAGSVTVPATITAAGTTGAQTINKRMGSVNFAAAATSLVVTNSLVTANSFVSATIQTNDATATVKNVVPAAGSFTINLGAAATAETKVFFNVTN